MKSSLKKKSIKYLYYKINYYLYQIKNLLFVKSIFKSYLNYNIYFKVS
jgi:hypothetical protein